MTKYQKKKSYWKKRCDQIFAESVKLKAGDKCLETETKENIQCAHIIPRSYHATRWDFDNAIALTLKRHKFYSHHPLEWRKFIDKMFGKRHYLELQERALKYEKRSLKDYQELYAKLEKVRNIILRQKRKFEIKR